MAETCFTRFDPVLPARDKVRARLSNGEGGKRIYDAVAAGDEAAVQALVAGDRTLLRTVVRLPPGEEPYNGNDGDLLTFAVAACRPRTVALLLELGAAPDGERPGAALSYALLADTPDMAEMLLVAGASPDPVAPDQRAPFTVALTYGNLGAVQMLIRHGLRVDRTDEFGDTYLMEAAGIGAFRIAEALVATGANPWRIGMGGIMAAHAIGATGTVTGGAAGTEEDARARERLVVLTRKPGLPWPPPSPAETRDGMLSGRLPTPAMAAAGMVFDPVVLERLRASAR